MQEPSFLNNLQKGRHSHGVVVRVIRKWIHYENNGQGPPLYIGMVLADAKGSAIYAKISDDLIKEKGHLFDIGKVSVVRKFVVSNAKKSYRPVDKNLMIDVTDYTSVELVRNPPHSIPEYIYRITPLRAIKPARVVYNLIDVLGYLIKYEAAHTFVPKNTEKAKTLREIHIKDLGENVMKITLWGDQATGFNIDNVYDATAGNLIVCLIVGCSAREDFKNNDKTCLTGTSACTYYFNPSIPEARGFHSRFKNTPVYIERPAQEEETAPTAIKDVQLLEKTIAELNNVDPFDDENTGPYKVTVTILSIINTSSWWYMACKPCKKKVGQQLDGSYRCPKCDGTDTVPRYLLSFTAEDSTDEARFFAFDDEATKMIQKDCQALINPLYAKDALPQALQNILNKKFILSVDLTNESCKSVKKRQYQVKAVLETPAKHSSTKAISTSHYDPTQGTSSAPVIESPHRSSELILIEAATQSTPPPAIAADHNISKNNTDRSPTKATSARRNLFGQTDSAAGGDSEEEAHNDDLSVQSSQPKSKRQKNSANNNDGDNASKN